MKDKLMGFLDEEIAKLKTEQRFVNLRVLETAQMPVSVIDGKKVVNLECGWPNGGSPNGAAIPGSSEQNAALMSIIKEAGNITVLFSFSNDLWKEPGPFGVENKWGCVDNLT